MTQRYVTNYVNVLAAAALTGILAFAQSPGAPPIVDWAPDGKILVSSNNLLARFDLNTGEEELIDNFGGAFAFHPNGKSVALARGNVVEVRSYPQLAPEVQVWPPNQAEPTALAWSPDGAMLAVGTDTGHVLLWSMESEELTAEIETPVRGPVARFRFSGDGGRLLAILEIGQAVLIDTRKAERSYEVVVPAREDGSGPELQEVVDLSPSGGRILATRVLGENSDVLLLDDTGQEIWSRPGYAMEFTRDGTGVLALSWPFRVVGLYSAADGTAITTFEPPPEVSLLFFVRQSPDGKYLLGVGEDRRTEVIVLWDFETGELKAVHR